MAEKHGPVGGRDGHSPSNLQVSFRAILRWGLSIVLVLID